LHSATLAIRIRALFYPEEINYMPTLRAKPDEPAEILARRFKRACEKAGILTEMRRREFHEKPTTARKRRKAAAVKRHWKRIFRERPSRERSSH
jgi:small subunit ribosomal protein S21